MLPWGKGVFPLFPRVGPSSTNRVTQSCAREIAGACKADWDRGVELGITAGSGLIHQILGQFAHRVTDSLPFPHLPYSLPSPPCQPNLPCLTWGCISLHPCASLA